MMYNALVLLGTVYEMEMKWLNIVSCIDLETRLDEVKVVTFHL